MSASQQDKGMSTSQDKGKSTLKGQNLTFENVVYFLRSDTKLMGNAERMVAAALAKHFGVKPKEFYGTPDYLNGTLASLLRTIRSESAPKKAKEEQMETGGESEVKLTYAKTREIVKGLSPETFEMGMSELEAHVCEQLGISEWDKTAQYAQKKSFSKFIKSCQPRVRNGGEKKNGKQKLKAKMQSVKKKTKVKGNIGCLTLGSIRTVKDETNGGWTNIDDVARQRKEKKERQRQYRKQMECSARFIQQWYRAKLALMKEKRRLEKAAKYDVLLERQEAAQTRLQASIKEAERRDEEENRRFDVEVEEMIHRYQKGWLEKFNKSWKGKREEWSNGRSQEAVDEYVRLYNELSAFVVESGFMEREINFGVIEEMTQEIDHVVKLVKRLIDEHLEIVKRKWESPTGRKTLKKVKKGKKSTAGGVLPPERKMKFPKYLVMIRAAVTAAIDTWTSSKHSCESNLIGKLRKVLFWACADAATSKKTSKKSSLSKKGKWRLKALVHQMKTGTALPNPNYVEPCTSAVANSKKSSFNDRLERRQEEVPSWAKKPTFRFVKPKSDEELEMAKDILATSRIVDSNGNQTKGARKLREKLMRRNGHLSTEEAEAIVQEKFDWKMEQSRKKKEKERNKLEKEAREKRTSVDALVLKKLEKDAKKSGSSANHLVRQMLLQGVKGKKSVGLSEYELGKKKKGVEQKMLKDRLYKLGKISKRTGRATVSKSSRKSGKQFKWFVQSKSLARHSVRTRVDGPKRRSQRKKAEEALAQEERRIANKKAAKAKADAETKANAEVE